LLWQILRITQENRSVEEKSEGTRGEQKAGVEASQGPLPLIASKNAAASGHQDPSQERDKTVVLTEPPSVGLWDRVKRGIQVFTRAEWVMVFLTVVIAWQLESSA
jgi:hypothetical protein